jgi:histidyl-tRNA synthetase
MGIVPSPENGGEPSIPKVKGTVDWLPTDHERLLAIESRLLREFSLAGFDRLNTPVLEPVELHERKSGAGIVGKLFEVSGLSGPRVCLRPELTAGVVRAYTQADPAPPLPWRISHSGPTFRRDATSRPGRLREFRQVGVERLGDSGIHADAELLALAWTSLHATGVVDARIRIGHVGLILEMLGRSGLPPTAQASLVEMLSEAAAEGGDVGSVGRGLDHFAEWLGRASGGEHLPLPTDGIDDSGVERLFRTLVPVINGRRSGREILGRLRRKWDQGHSWLDALDRVRDRSRALSDLKGSPHRVLDRLAAEFERFAPDSIASVRSLVEALQLYGIPVDRMELDLGFGRGIGFYSQVVFEISATTPEGLIEVCGGGRYDGLARVLGSDRDDRGAGFAFGLERLDSVLSAQGHQRPIASGVQFLVVPRDASRLRLAVEAANWIRARGFRATLDFEGKASGEIRVVRVGTPGRPALSTEINRLEELAFFVDRESNS